MTVEYLKSGKPDAERAEDDAKTRIIVEETLKNIEKISNLPKSKSVILLKLKETVCLILKLKQFLELF